MKQILPAIFAFLLFLWSDISAQTQTEILRKRYTATLLGEGIAPDNPYFRTATEVNSKKISEHLAKCENRDNFQNVFTDLTLPLKGKESVEGSKSINGAYSRLRDISIGLASPHSHFYYAKSDKNQQLLAWVLDALRYLNRGFYSTETFGIYYEDLDGNGVIMPFKWVDKNGDKIKQEDEVEVRRCNWWHMEIGIPRDLNDIIALLYDHIQPEERNAYLAAIDTFIPSPDWTTGGAAGANGTWATKNVALRAILAGNPMPANLNTPRYRYSVDKLTAAKLKAESLINTFPLESGIGKSYNEGFYEDGSCISHSRNSYTGGYGAGMLSDNINLISIFEGSDYAISDSKREIIAGWIQNSFIPLLAYGSMMDYARGREIARTYQGIGTGISILASMVNYSEMALPEDHQWLLPFIKQQMNYLFDYMGAEEFYRRLGGSDAHTKITAQKIYSDSSIPSMPELRMSRVFPIMNRSVHHGRGFVAGVAAHSCRIYNYEGINSENNRGWHTSDGMFYLYNRDIDHYNDDFWPTVDAHYLAGTTVERLSEMGSGNKVGRNHWSGGCHFSDTHSTVGTQLQPAVPATLSANKSYFFFDNIIVFLGSGVSDSAEGKDVCTVVENRKLRNDNSNTFTLNGQRIAATTDIKAENPKWAHLSGNVEGAAIGYLFFGSSSVEILREERQASWREINTYDPFIDRTMHKRNYLSIKIPHGVSPQNGGYAYAIVPNASAKLMEKYSRRSPIKIIDNTAKVHSALGNGIYCANFWDAASTSDGFIKSSGAAAVIAGTQGEVFRVAISDPTQLSETLVIEIDRKLGKLNSYDARVKEITTKDGKSRIVVDTRNLYGMTLCLDFSKSKKN